VRLLLDTNVVVSALLWRGTPYRLLAAIRERGDVQLVTSITLLDELADVLARPFAAQRLAMIGRTVRDVVADYVELVELVEPAKVPRVVLGDVDDDQVIAAAVAARVDLIVTGDRRHLLPIGIHDGIAIVDAGEAVRRITTERRLIRAPPPAR
jgi:putative PIN family toxin of toxin-antitoxin system